MMNERRLSDLLDSMYCNMNYKLYAIRDKYTGFLSPAPDMTDDSAKRNFAMAVNNNPGVMNFSPRDYDLYKIGEYDTHTGEIVPLQPIQFICNGGDVLNEE